MPENKLDKIAPGIEDKITSDNLFKCRLHALGQLTEGQCAKHCRNMTRVEIRALSDLIKSLDDMEIVYAIENILNELERGDYLSLGDPSVKNLQWAFAKSFNSLYQFWQVRRQEIEDTEDEPHGSELWNVERQ